MLLLPYQSSPGSVTCGRCSPLIALAARDPTECNGSGTRPTLPTGTTRAHEVTGSAVRLAGQRVLLCASSGSPVATHDHRTSAWMGDAHRFLKRRRPALGGRDRQSHESPPRG